MWNVEAFLTSLPRVIGDGGLVEMHVQITHMHTQECTQWCGLKPQTQTIVRIRWGVDYLTDNVIPLVLQP